MTENETDLLGELALRAENGEATHVDLIDTLLTATVYVPSVTDPAEGELNPVVSRIDEVDYMIVASTVSALDHTGDVAAFGVPLTGRAVITSMNGDLALMVNTDSGAFALPQAMLVELREQSNPLA